MSTELVEHSKKMVEYWKLHHQGKKQLGYICKFCATEIKEEWADGHVATTHMGNCSVCEQEHSVVSPSDWKLGNDGKRRKIKSWEWD